MEIIIENWSSLNQNEPEIKMDMYVTYMTSVAMVMTLS